LQLTNQIDIVVPYQGKKSHDTDFAIVRNGREATRTDPGYNSFDFDYVMNATRNLEKGSRANVAESFGFSLLSFEAAPDKAAGCYRPSMKKNTVGNCDIASLFLSMTDSIRYMDPEKVFYNPLHPQVADWQYKFSRRIGTEAGFDNDLSKRIIGEGMTLFFNPIPSQFIEKSKDQASGIEEPQSLRHLELEIADFLKDMPIKPHTDRKNCALDNFNILTCTLKCVLLPDGQVARIGGLLYFRESCSHFVAREKIGDIIEHHLQVKITEMPVELKEVIPHVPQLLKSEQGGIFAHPPHLNKCVYFSLLVNRINHLSRVHQLTLPRCVELCSIALALNGMEIFHG
jgi:hypothetical protein